MVLADRLFISGGKMSVNRDKAYYSMYQAYLENETSYWQWSDEQKLFQQRAKERFYYKKGVNREKRRVLAEAVLRDFPNATFRDVASQIGGCRDIIWEFGLWETPHEPYWMESGVKFAIYERLKNYPDEIYEAIEETYEWSIKIGVRTTLVENLIPEILKDIGERNLLTRSFGEMVYKWWK